MISSSAKRIVKNNMIAMQQRTFSAGVVPKLPKMELTMRSPYETFFKDFAGFSRVYINTIVGRLSIGNRSVPRVYLLPPGLIEVMNLAPGNGMLCKSEEGKFVHTGGWLFLHDNNSLEINILEATQKEDFDFNALDQCKSIESDSPAGRAGALLQEKTIRLLQKRA